MKKVPDIFKPGINKTINNNDKVFYSALQDDLKIRTVDSKAKPKRNIKQEVLINKSFNKKYLIKTSENNYYSKIIDRMGNNIIIESGQIISISDISGIYEE